MPRFADRITRRPLPLDLDAAREVAAQFADLGAPTRDVLAGAAGSSPYLRGLMGKEADWLQAVLADANPDDVVAAELARLSERPTAAEAQVELRRAKRRVALYAALADLGGVWDLAAVTAALSDLADLAVDRALRAALAPLLAQRKVPGQGPDDLPEAAGICVLAMGKLGSRALNYSSDIDLICLFDQTRFAPDDLGEARAAFVKATRKMTALLSEPTADGYVFRTDLRLRPDAAVTPVCLSMEAAEAYYESVGRTWERAAFIKARPIAGDVAAGGAFLERLSPFIWRRHLDFAAIRDAFDMRKTIHTHKGLHSSGLDGRDIKLAPGGIREIEFFVQTHQLIFGGRDPSLRVRGTREALERLVAADRLSAEAADTLSTCYVAHRELEHRLQMVADAQTHTLPRSEEGFDRIARLAGEADTAQFRFGIEARLTQVRATTEPFYRPHVETSPASDPDRTEEDPDAVAGWARFPALRTERARESFARLKPDLLRRLGASETPDEALAAFEGFLSGLPAGVQIFSLFEANPSLLALVVDISTSAPPLARYLSRNAGVLDAVLSGDFFEDLPPKSVLQAAISKAMADVEDYEQCLDAARIAVKEFSFRIGVQFLRGLLGAERMGACYADLAEATVAALFPVVTEHFAARHGPPPGHGAAVMAMGSLGAGWLNAASDLDLIVIYDPADAEASDGPRPLAVRPYYARLTQALVTALTAPTAEGRLYAVDMRLRPSGRQGPVATSLTSFDSYQRSEAWTWEHLALTRARTIAGPAALRDAIEAVRSAVLAAPRGALKTRADVQEMRERLARHLGAVAPLDPQAGPGRLKDVELTAQTLALLSASSARAPEAQIKDGVAAGLVSQPAAADLSQACGLFRAVKAGLRLVSDGDAAPSGLPKGALDLICRETGHASADTLADAMADQAQRAVGRINAVLAAPDT